MLSLPQLNSPLTPDQLKFLETFAKSCRYSAIAMLNNSQSGHSGGSMSGLDYLSLLYSFIISQTGEKVVVSNGHISPAVYSVLAEMGYIPKNEVIANFRKIGSRFEGHITRQVDGVWYGTGPLGIGASVAEGFALAQKLRKEGGKVYALIGDGEAEEGQIYEMMQSADKYQLDNLIVFVDFNQVQLSGSLNEIMPLNLKGHFKAAGWEVLETNGHEFSEMWQVLGKAQTVQDHPVVIIGHTIMGKGVDFMEEDGRQLKSTWHGIAPSPEQAEKALQQLQLSPEEKLLLDEFRAKLIAWTPPRPNYIPLLTQDQQVKGGEPIVYAAGTSTDCRSAYGKALLDLAQNNPQVVALAADLRGSVKTEEMGKKFPERHIEVGIAEQNMVSIAGGLSLSGFVPFASTFGAFMTSRAKDQARVNDINVTNVKMVATHCGLSVGEDGPTHQAIDDLGSFLGFYNTMLIEPVDANHTDRIIRYIATHYGNFYVRMGRHKFPVLLKEDGSVFYDADYQYQYGRTEVVREGNEVTIVAVGACVGEAVLAWEKLEGKAEVVAVSSIKQFDQTLVDSIAKTGRVITVEDHNPVCGLAAQVSRLIVEKGIKVEKFISLGVPEYQFSGTNAELYRAVGIDAAGIGEAVKKMLIV